METKIDIICVGELAVDTIGYTDKITDTPSSPPLKSISTFYGGRGGNVSVFARLFNQNVAIVAGLGNDIEGKEYEKYLKDRKIKTDLLFYSKQPLTSRAFHFNDDEQSRIFFYPGVVNDDHENYMEHVKKILNINSDVMSCFSNSQEVNLLFLNSSKAKIKAYSPSQSLHLYEKESIEKCLEASNILFINEHESKIIENKLKINIEEIIESYNIKILIKTLSERGSNVITRGGTEHIFACKPDKVLDPTGAGDAYAGSFISNYLKTEDPIYSAKLASTVASFVVEEFGCQTKIPSLYELGKRMKENYSIDL